ncbi:translation initiation factor IF-2 [Candidatus Purcelliella pentastirinorum]|uniref:translation initiation factor IF-2 n=1 Tax=Candidatus Purcelliella pentastirinorum TaxID=472834 RepID=UPI00237B62C7|nr:translation initiation factor IF-2 [Candidatus Purcelliella pentastirinorum]WDR80626.1 translation initiation factor IF-2 [Candidatus Purcelliella pentastirinorum]
MCDINIKKLAKKIKISKTKLIKKLSNIGIYKSINDTINCKEKKIILKYFENKKNTQKKFTIKRKKLSIYNIPTINGINKSIQIEIRKKHTYIKNINNNKKNTLKTKKIKNIFKLINSKNKIKEINNHEITKLKQKQTNIDKKNKIIETNFNIYDYKKQNKKTLYTKIKEKNNIKNNIKKNKINILNKKNKKTILKQNFNKLKKNINKEITIKNNMSVIDLAKKMAIKKSKIIKIINDIGINSIKNELINKEIIQLIVEELGYKITFSKKNNFEKKNTTNQKNNKKPIIKIRPPIVTIMGHVDHGKTSLLKYINSNRTKYKEDGNITQNLYSYQINTEKGLITFIDTPGHSAFTTMRSSGAKITDIIVLIIAANDGIMPQTIEAINQAQRVKVPIIVAINKIDIIKSKSKEIKKELTKYNIIPEEWGGENLFVEISAKFGQGINELLENIILQSEILELKTNINTLAKGIVIESYLDKQKGPIINVITKEGILKKGNIILCGTKYGKIKAMHNEHNEKINEVFPSVPVKILGLSGIPNIGDVITVTQNEKIAKEIAFYRKKQKREIKFNKIIKNDKQDIFKENIQKINILIKANNHGQLRAILDTIYQLKNKTVKINIISYNIGWITKTDVNLANTTKSIIFGFNVKSENTIKKIIKNTKIKIRYHNIIYKLIEDIELIIKNIEKKQKNKNKQGIAEVKNIFKSPNFGTIAGCLIKEGTIKNFSNVIVIRNEKIMYNGKIESLRRFKTDVKEVNTGSECGITLKNLNNILPGDIIKTL